MAQRSYLPGCPLPTCRRIPAEVDCPCRSAVLQKCLKGMEKKQPDMLRLRKLGQELELEWNKDGQRMDGIRNRSARPCIVISSQCFKHSAYIDPSKTISPPPLPSTGSSSGGSLSDC